ncbi:MAG: thioredoxin [Methylophilaceae bacterium]|nr:MAG: thioredoxin [Methylophilaceae bacterium]
MIKHKKLLLPFAILGLVALMAFSYFNQPKIADAVFTTIEGEKISMASLKGKVVLVNFWATDCTSCVKEMPDLINTYNKYKNKGLEIIAVAMPYDPPAQVVNFATQKKLPFPVMHDGYGNIVQKFGGISVTPTALIYNKEGKRIQHAVGTLNFDKLHALLDKELS